MNRLSVVSVVLGLMTAAVAAGAPATHEEGKSINVAAAASGAKAASLALAADGSLLVCDGANKALLVLSPEGRLKARWPLDFAPQAACAHGAEAIYVGGHGQVARLDKAGKTVAAAAISSGGHTRVGAIASIATDGQDVFVAAMVGFGFSVFRLGHNLEEPKEMVSRLRGCCGQMNLVAKDGVLYVAENARHRVVRFDREGKELGAWGKASRTDLEGFGSCCNPMNVAFGPGGELYTSESEGRVKRHAPADGAFLGLVGLPKMGGGCLNVAVAISPDARRVYVLDTQANAIRVLEKK